MSYAQRFPESSQTTAINVLQVALKLTECDDDKIIAQLQPAILANRDKFYAMQVEFRFSVCHIL